MLTFTYLRRASRTCALIAALMLVGCGYGEVSPRGYDYAKALYSICNRQDESRLGQFVGLIDADLQEGKISAAEADWFREIAAQADSGDWQSASAAARALLEDQVQK